MGIQYRVAVFLLAAPLFFATLLISLWVSVWAKSLLVYESGVSSRPVDELPVAYMRSARLKASQGELKEAIVLAEQAVQWRATWPYDWMALAEYYAEARIYDDRLDRALENVTRYGASERSLVYRKAIFSIRHWYGLSSRSRQLMKPSIQLVLGDKRLAKRFFYDVISLNRTRLFCRQFSGLVEYGPVWCVAFKKQQVVR